MNITLSVATPPEGPSTRKSQVEEDTWVLWRGEKSQRSCQTLAGSCDCHMMVLLQVGALDSVADFCRIISRSASIVAVHQRNN